MKFEKLQLHFIRPYKGFILIIIINFFIEVCDPACDHGKCVKGKCQCEDPWVGKACDKSKIFYEHGSTFGKAVRVRNEQNIT